MKINRQSRKTLIYLLAFYIIIPNPGKTQARREGCSDNVRLMIAAG